MPVNRQTFLAGVLVAGSAGLVFGGLAGCVAGYQLARHPAGTLSPSDRVLTRDEFRAAVMGKTPNEVIQVLGKPDSTTDAWPQFQSWCYHDRVRDPLSGKVHREAWIRFDHGRVADVRYDY